MEAAVARVVILGRAALAHLERCHGGERPVVGDAPHDREARPAVGAVGERVAVAAVGLVPQLGQAVGAGGRVGRDQRLALPARPAGHDREPLLPHRRHGPGGDPLDDGQRRRLGLQGPEELGHRAVVPLDLDEDAPGVVADEAGEVEPGGEAVDERPEADALNDPLDADPCSHPAAGRGAHPGSGSGSTPPGPRASCTSVHSTW